MSRERLLGVWRRVLSLAWPVMAEQTFRTAMRTTDIIVTAQFSPAAVVAIGLADLYARFPLRIGLGLGGGAIALSSQDTGAAADANRDEAVTQAVLMGLLAGVPFVFIGLLFGEPIIALLGADANTAALGGTYLAIVFATAPARHVALIGARSLQGTGDTRTPMYVNVLANALNIAGSFVLGLGLLGAPRLDIVGVGIATAGANVLTAVLLLGAMATSWAEASLVRPRDGVIAKQLVRVSAPRVLEGFSATIAEFPFNALLLGFGTEVNAGFQIGRRMYQQVTGPLSRGYNVAASVVVGQALGDGDAAGARYNGYAVTGLGLATVGVIGVLLVALAPAFVSVFTDDAGTVPHAVAFARVYGATAAFLVAFTVLSGALQGASETRIPLVGRLVGTFGFLLGTTYLVGEVLGFGARGAYLGVGLQYVCMTAVVLWGFRYTRWASRAAEMMAERGSGDGDGAESVEDGEGV
ncbi:MATE family efflux transporter [Halobaculum magnesiiphilum]|uniref:Multidrug-efflux transporter n=1 Tax=Halobaculum magnesiiphilum TaxID=1017351 RepID=A0A8T8WAW8_9EURY|nr:MATE family efflux transporter [Halobaculum magnesiiphilum]QZP36975.1 MATE family efflux transporter [Halobaculum magnesiiphilum]